MCNLYGNKIIAGQSSLNANSYDDGRRCNGMYIYAMKINADLIFRFRLMSFTLIAKWILTSFAFLRVGSSRVFVVNVCVYVQFSNEFPYPIFKSWTIFIFHIFLGFVCISFFFSFVHQTNLNGTIRKQWNLLNESVNYRK